MKKLYTLTLGAALLANFVFGQTIWTGETITFTKTGFSDFTLEENQDRITDDVWITRGNTMGLFNAATESSYFDFLSPAGTEWAFGTTADIDNLTFESWEGAISGVDGSDGPPDAVNQDMVLHLVEDDIYIDIRFTAWGIGSGGGGSFTYERSSDQSLGTIDESGSDLGLFPNPSSDFIRITGFGNNEQYVIFNAVGQRLSAGWITEGEELDVSGLETGLYLVQVGSNSAIPFVKN